jgi:DNA-binding SARP family transcriptional activator
VGLKFYLLGPPQVTWNDTVLDIPRRQVRVLLYYLASYPNAVPQERLHYLLWNDKPEAVCRRNMSHLLTHARSSLPDKNALVVNDSLVMLDPQSIWCDVEEFKKLIHSSSKDGRLDNFKQAVEYYRGPFLDGLQLPDEPEFESLIELERFNLERNYLNLLYKLVMTEKRGGNYESAIEYAYQYLARDNLAEEVHRQLIMLHGLTGNRERALNQYKICKDVLHSELQAEPSMKTMLAYQHVLAESPSTENNIPVQKSLEMHSAKIEPMFVDSESYDHFINLLEGADRSDHGYVAMLHGELGIGKSSLFTRVFSRTGRNKLVIRARCDSAVRSIPYWPIKNLLMREFKAHASTRAIVPEYIGGTRIPSGVPEGTDENISADAASKEKFFTVLVNSIVALAEEPGGLIFCIEDLEWADPETLELFLYLSRYTQTKKIWLFGSYCCPENQCLVDFLHKLQFVDGFLGDIQIRGVGKKQIETTVKFLIGDLKFDENFIRHLHHLSGGNPLFISELLRLMAESGLSMKDLMDEKIMTLPPTASKTIKYRLSRLSQTERRVLEVAAAIGFTFKVDRVSQLSDLSVMQVLDALDELVSRHFLQIRSTQYQFAHELVRQTILNDMSPARRQYLEESCLRGLD